MFYFSDIMDKELKELRNARWTRAFNEVPDANPMDTVHRKGTSKCERK